MKSMKPWLRKNNRRPTQKRQKSFCIFTEGNTEKIYFEDFGLVTVEVRCLGGGDVLHLVSEALSYMKQPRYTGYDYYWIVFDRDDNPEDKLHQAIEQAKKHKISWCFSNPCFELWFLLHFDFFQAQTTPDELKTRLIPDRIPGYTETMPGIFDLLKDKQAVAIRNSRKLWPKDTRSSRTHHLSELNPATNVDDLVCSLNACLASR